MDGKKTKSIMDIERKMEKVDEGSLRHRALKSAKDFKTSWIELGQSLYAVWKDKLYREWGYQEFDNYTSKEIGIRNQTALKLMRSYSFLEQEEPRYAKKDYYGDNVPAAAVPTFEAVDVVRKAKANKNVDRSDYASIKKYVLEEGKDVAEVKKDLTAIIKRGEELQPEEIRRKKRAAQLKRLISLIRAASREIKISKLLPAEIMKEIDNIADKLEAGADSV